MFIVTEILETYEEITKEYEEPEDIMKRSVDDLVMRNSSSNQCRSEVWHCMSDVMEGGLRYVEKPNDIYSSLTPVLYKAVFHGGMKSMWSSVMEVQSILNYHVQCLISVPQNEKDG